MLSEGAVRGFRKWFFVFQGHVPRCFLCCRKALFEAFGSGFSRPCVEVLSEGAVRGFRKWFFKAMCRGVFYVVGRRCSRLSEVVFRFPRPCAEVFFLLSEGAVRDFRKWFFKAMCRGVVGRRCSRLSESVVFQGHVLR